MSGTVIRDVVVKLRIEQTASKITVPGLQQSTLQIQQANEATKSWAGGIKELAEENKHLAAQEKARVDNEAKVHAAQDKLLSAQLQMGAAVKQSAGGLMALARSYAYLTAAGEEDLKKSVQNIAMVEGVIHSMTGLIDIVSGVAQGYKAMRGAALATAAANALLAASNGAVAATGAAAGAAGGGGGVAGAAAGGIFKTVTGMLTGATAAFVAKFVAIPALIAGALIEGLSAVTGGKIAGFSDVLSERSKASQGTDSLNKKYAGRVRSDQDTARRDNLDLEEFNDKQRARQGAAAGAADRAGLAVQMSTDSPEVKALRQADNERLAAVKRLKQAKEDAVDAAVENSRRELHGQSALTETALAAATAQKDAAENLKSAERQRLSVLQEQGTALRSNKKEAQGALDTAKAALVVEQQKGQSAAAKFGRLDQGTQKRVLAINAKIQSGGEATEQDARELDRAGLGGDLSEQVYAKKGRDAGADSLDKSLSGVDPRMRQQLEQTINQKSKDIESINKKIEDSNKEIDKQGKATEKAMVERDKAFLDLLKAIAAQSAASARVARNSALAPA